MRKLSEDSIERAAKFEKGCMFAIKSVLLILLLAILGYALLRAAEYDRVMEKRFQDIEKRLKSLENPEYTI